MRRTRSDAIAERLRSARHYDYMDRPYRSMPTRRDNDEDYVCPADMPEELARANDRGANAWTAPHPCERHRRDIGVKLVRDDFELIQKHKFLLGRRHSESATVRPLGGHVLSRVLAEWASSTSIWQPSM
jgi:hypothetical protein